MSFSPHVARLAREFPLDKYTNLFSGTEIGQAITEDERYTEISGLMREALTGLSDNALDALFCRTFERLEGQSREVRALIQTMEDQGKTPADAMPPEMVEAMASWLQTTLSIKMICEEIVVRLEAPSIPDHP